MNIFTYRDDFKHSIPMKMLFNQKQLKFVLLAYNTSLDKIYRPDLHTYPLILPHACKLIFNNGFRDNLHNRSKVRCIFGIIPI